MGRNRVLKKLGQLSIVMLSAYVATGCPSQNTTKLLANSGSTQEAIAQEAITQEAEQSASSAVNYEVCADVENWQRPSEAAQAKHIRANARYSEGAQPESLKATFNQFWNNSVVSFTTYGLSARMEPENLSGVWTAADEIVTCYSPEDTVAINEGNRAETWLLNQRISDLEWTGDRYLMTVEPAPSGLQIIQFDRTDEMTSLPLDVVSASGEPISVMSGDWQ